MCIKKCRSPRGERGLKSYKLFKNSFAIWSLSSRRAWIEIHLCFLNFIIIESLSSRRAWIEIVIFTPPK